MKHIIPIIFTSLLLFACSGGDKSKRTILIKSDKVLSFTIDDNTKTKITVLFPYTGSDGKEYLTFQNSSKNEIQFYDMRTEELAFKLEPEVNGENGIGFLRGYTIKNRDSIFVATQGKAEISLIDCKGNVKDRYKYDKTEDGHFLHYGAISSYRYKPIIFHENKMYILPTGNRWGAELEKGINGLDLLEYGHRNFSIIILNEDFEIIGETLFPDYTYNSRLMFVREDGLYISTSHFMNPNYSDDILSFQRVDLSREP